MRAVVVYESMFGNTHEVAEQIAEGLRIAAEVEVLAVGDAIGRILGDVDLLVVGGPTHAHGMSRHATRSGAADQADQDVGLTLEAGADGPGVREWLHGMPADHGTAAAAFDTRLDAPAAFTGRASKGIARQLHKHGFRTVTDPESFLVDKEHRLIEGEASRARVWGGELAGLLATLAG